MRSLQPAPPCPRPTQGAALRWSWLSLSNACACPASKYSLLLHAHAAPQHPFAASDMARTASRSPYSNHERDPRCGGVRISPAGNAEQKRHEAARRAPPAHCPALRAPTDFTPPAAAGTSRLAWRPRTSRGRRTKTSMLMSSGLAGVPTPLFGHLNRTLAPTQSRGPRARTRCCTGARALGEHATGHSFLAQKKRSGC